MNQKERASEKDVFFDRGKGEEVRNKEKERNDRFFRG